MKYRGIPSCSVEINPYLHFVGTVKTRTYADLDAIRDVFHAFSSAAGRRIEPFAERSALGRLSCRECGSSFRGSITFIVGGRPGNLMQLVCLRKLLLAYKAEPEYHDLLKMGLLAILIPVSNAKHNHVSLTFAEKPLDTVDVGAILQAEIRGDAGRLALRAEVAMRRSGRLPRKQPISDDGLAEVSESVGSHHVTALSKPFQLCPGNSAPFVLLRVHRERRGGWPVGNRRHWWNMGKGNIRPGGGSRAEKRDGSGRAHALSEGH